MSLVFDALMLLALLWSAWRALTAADLTHAVVTFIVFGLLMTLAWARLGAPDVALAEAAIGAGLTGALLLDALNAGLRRGQPEAAARRWRAPVLLLSLPLGLLLALWALGLPAPAVDLATAVHEKLANSGVTHPVTAVLLNFRGHDTLLEIAVLLAALWSLLAVAHRERAPASTQVADPVLESMARLAVPAMVLVAGYLLWAGAHRPGGAFQAGAVLAGAVVLLHLARLQPPWAHPGRLMRIGIVAGFLVFLGVAALSLPQGELLRYPLAWAGALILLIETGLTLSLALVLAGLFMYLSAPGRGP